jgi:hypothetical protein
MDSPLLRGVALSGKPCQNPAPDTRILDQLAAISGEEFVYPNLGIDAAAQVSTFAVHGGGVPHLPIHPQQPTN